MKDIERSDVVVPTTSTTMEWCLIDVKMHNNFPV